MHVITGLEVGGAESMLSRLVRAMDPGTSSHLVVSLTGEGPIGRELATAGIEVRALGLRRGQVSLAPLFTMRRWLREWRPDVLETWMYHADLLGALVTLGRSAPPLIWNLRASHLDMRQYRPLSGVTRALCARLSRRPALVIANSDAGVREHRALGYAPRRWAVVPNGIDVARYRPRPERRDAVRGALGLPSDAFVLGVVARYDPMKGHDVLAGALGLWLARWPGAHVLVAGAGIDWQAPEYSALKAAMPELASRVHLLGLRRDVADLWSACDVAGSPSHGEGFANAIAEAMACGVPVVATAVGDSAQIVGGEGVTVPPADPGAFAVALDRIASLAPADRQAVGLRARKRVAELFSLDVAAARYLDAYRSVAQV